MEGIDKYEYLKSKEARNRWIRDMLYQILIDWNTVEDKDSMFFRNNRINQPDGIFQLEFWKITEETANIYHDINIWLSHIKPWDTIARIHVKAPIEVDNLEKKSSKELMIDGMKRTRDQVLTMPIEKRPKYLISYSHITTRLASKYWFIVYDIPENIKKWSWSIWFFDIEEQKKLQEYLEWFENAKENKRLSHDEELQEEKESKKWKHYFTTIPSKYTPDDIKLIVEPIEHLLNITDDYFEQLKKPSS